MLVKRCCTVGRAARRDCRSRLWEAERSIVGDKGDEIEKALIRWSLERVWLCVDGEEDVQRGDLSTTSKLFFCRRARDRDRRRATITVHLKLLTRLILFAELSDWLKSKSLRSSSK